MKNPLKNRRDSREAGEKPNGRLAMGLLLIGTGRAAGFAQFGGSREAFLGSLAPLLGFLIVLGGVVAWSGRPLDGLAAILSGLCDLLAPVVIADLFCRAWGRRQHWLLYANVLNCAQWMMLAVLAVLLPVGSVGMAAGLSSMQAAALLMTLFGLYILWFHWFTARHVLDLSRGRALLVMAAVVFGTGLLLQLPPLIAGRPVAAKLFSTSPEPAAAISKAGT